VGEEVLVTYEQGDPCRPLVLGAVYSSKNPPPVEADANPYRSTIKTAEGKDANQISFNDKLGKQTLDITARKDLTLKGGRNLKIEVADNITLSAKKVNVINRKNITV
jgi:type VI secretion system secreted protein VgrG